MQLLSVEKKTWLAGDVRRLTLKIAAPSVAAMVASAFCSLLETLILGRSDAQLSAAIGACFALTALEQTVGFTLGMGAGSSVSRCLGCGSSGRALRSASVGFFSALAISCVFPVIGLFFAAPALSLLGASAGGSSGTVYARYVCLCAPPLCGSLTLSSLLRAQGKTLPNMASYAVGSILGAALLYIFCVLLNFGVHGAGAAMLIREIAIFAILLFSLCRDASLIRPRLRCAKPTLPVLLEIMRSGLPSLLRQGTTSLSAVLLSRICAGFGAHALSGMGLAVRVCTLYSSALIGFGQGFQPVCGVNLGAGKLSRLWRNPCAECRRVSLCPRPDRPFRTGCSNRRFRILGSACTKCRLFCSKCRCPDDHAHAGDGHDRPFFPCRNQQAGSFLHPASAHSAAPIWRTGVDFLSEHQRSERTSFFLFSDQKYLSHSIALYAKSLIRHPQVKVEAFHFRMGNGAKPPVFYRFLVRTVRMFGYSDSVPIIST